MTNESYKVFDPFLGKEVEISERLTDRLRGRYASGPTLPNGEPEFGWREFGPPPPIQLEAAAEIERLTRERDATLDRALDCETSIIGHEAQERKWGDEALAAYVAENQKLRARCEAAEKHAGAQADYILLLRGDNEKLTAAQAENEKLRAALDKIDAIIGARIPYHDAQVMVSMLTEISHISRGSPAPPLVEGQE